MGRRWTRRELALVTGAVAAASKAKAATNKPLPLQPELDPVAYTLGLHDQAPRKLAFKAATKAEAIAWQKQLRPKIAELLGGFPARTPLQAEIYETRDFPTYTRQRILFTSRPGMKVSGYLLIPKAGSAPHATMICVPGHGRGADDLVGIDEHGNDTTARAGYQFDFALQAVEKGFAAFAIEPMAFGCRRDERTSSKGAGTSSCQPSAGAALLLGQTMIGWRVYDVMRAIDYLETRPEINAKRIGCMGISGGGTCTLFSSALDTRIRAAYVSGYLNTFKGSIMSLSHCIDNYVPGILHWAEMYDVAGLIAPRPLFVESGEKDPIFPIASSRESFAKVSGMYRVFGSDAIEQEVFPEKHLFWGRQGWDFLQKHL